MSDGVIHDAAAISFEGPRLRALGSESTHPLWFGSQGRELFGLYHAPAAVSGSLAVLLCNPFGYEAMCTHRSYLQLAHALAGRGLPVLRFDYHGCGDSSGDDYDPARRQAWLSSIHSAIDELKRLSGCAHVGLFGLRLGANIALEAASTRDDVTALALWAPFASGRTFLREELAVHKLRALDPRFDRPETRAPGAIEALGFAITAETLASIEGLRIADLTQLPAKSALVLWRETLLQEQRVADKLKELGAAVVIAAAGGYGEMLKDNVTPELTWSEIADYFERVRDEQGGNAARHPKLPLHANAQVHDSARAGSPVRERAAYFGADRRLFGVVSYADAALHSLDRPAVLLLSGGVNHHVGQNRMYTRWARRWAARGYDCFRFDLAGFGDSGGAHGGHAEQNGKLHAPDNVDDVRAAMDFLSQECGSRSFALVGLCSGALQGFHAALDDARIVSLGLLNWTRFMLDPSTVAAAAVSGTRDLGSTEHHRQYQSLRYYVRMAAGIDVWRRLYRGEVDARGITEHFLRRTLGRVRSELIHRLPSLYGDATPRTQLARDFESLAQRGVQTCVVYNGDEPILDVFREQLGPHLGRMIQAGSTRLELIDGTDHVFTPLWSQEHVFELMSKHVLGQ